MRLEARRVGWGASAAAAGLGTCAAVAFGLGDWPLAVAPVAALALAWGAWRLPLRHSALGLTFLVLVADNPTERSFAGRWQSPLYPLGRALFENLNNMTGIDALRFSLLDVAIAALGVIALARLSARSAAAPPSSLRGAPAGGPAAGRNPLLPSALALPLAAAFLTVLALEAWGLARGGDLRSSLWQLRQLAWAPALTLLLSAALPTTADVARLGKVILAAAAVKALFAVYFYEVVCRPTGFRPPFATSHSDTVLFVAAFALVLALWHERRTRGTWLLFLSLLPLLGLAMLMNHRRIAWVALAAAVATMAFVTPRTPVKRALARLSLLAAPLAALYLAIGWNAGGGLFRPAQMVRAVLTSQGDRSAQLRDIENFNLTRTLKQAPIVGSGFGHPYVEVTSGDNIAQIFPMYRSIPHNSLLGLWAFAGLAGFFVIWSPAIVGLFLAARAYPRLAGQSERAAALGALSVLLAWALQAWGDMGLQSWVATFLASAALATAGRLALSSGAWPVPARAAPALSRLGEVTS